MTKTKQIHACEFGTVFRIPGSHDLYRSGEPETLPSNSKRVVIVKCTKLSQVGTPQMFSADEVVEFLSYDPYDLARIAYFYTTHPMQYGNNAEYTDWIHDIARIYEASTGVHLDVDECKAIAACDPTNRLHP